MPLLYHFKIIGLAACFLLAAAMAEESQMDKTLINAFMAAAEEGRLPALLERHATVNIEFPTFGGHHFWESHRAHGWNLQVNTISGWWRILDADDVRVARGTTEEQLRNLLEDRPTSLLANYMDRGHCFSKTAATNPSGRSVLLIHGLSVRSRSMQRMANALAAEGYDAYNYDYPSSKMNIEAHTERFLQEFRTLMAILPTNERTYVLTHSMGGLILRGALARMTADEAKRLEAIVMLGPPNKGSLWAYLGKLPIVGQLNESLGDMTPDLDSYTMTLPPPVWLPPTGIIAGRRDGKVALEDTVLPAPLPYQWLMVDCTHPGLRNPENVLTQVLNFFKNKHF